MDPFMPISLGVLELPDRLTMAPVKTSYRTSMGQVNFRHEAYYRQIKEGGVGQKL